MLYDILFIDDDFDEPSDSNDWGSNAQKLFLELIQKNLRVTYTTGEIEDLERLESKDLSCIKYIFCDLNLLGITEDTDRKIKDIRSKLIGIFEKLNENIKSKELTVFINSKFSSEWDKVHDENFKLNVNERYTYKLVKNKNHLSDGDEKKLLKTNLNLHIKSLIIAKALEIEEVLDQKLRLTETAKERINFESKYYVFQSQFAFKEEVEKEVKKELQLLQQIRNKVAHTDNNLKEIKDAEMKRTFWEICSKQQSKEDIEFKDFQQLITYIESIEKLKYDLLSANAKNL